LDWIQGLAEYVAGVVIEPVAVAEVAQIQESVQELKGERSVGGCEIQQVADTEGGAEEVEAGTGVASPLVRLPWRHFLLKHLLCHTHFHRLTHSFHYLL